MKTHASRDPGVFAGLPAFASALLCQVHCKGTGHIRFWEFVRHVRSRNPSSDITGGMRMWANPVRGENSKCHLVWSRKSGVRWAKTSFPYRTGNACAKSSLTTDEPFMGSSPTLSNKKVY